MDVTCQACGSPFQAKSRAAKYCSDRCRKRFQRGGDVVELKPAAPVEAAQVSSMGAVEAATAQELQVAGKLDSALGQMCLAMARRLDSPGVDTGSALASAAGRLDALLEKATRGAGKVSAPQQLRDELSARRVRHGA